MTNLEAAIALGQAGMRVHPCRADKRPLTRFLETATTEPDAIADLWRRYADALIGVRTGDGLVVVDDDRGLAEPDPSLCTLTATTTRPGGWHYYFRSDEPVRNSIGKIAPGVDIRGEHGYVIAPPSQGRTWVNPGAAIEPLPDVLRLAIARAEPRGPAFELRDYVPAGERHAYLLSFAGWLVANDLASDYTTLVAELLEHADAVCEPPDRYEDRRRNVRGIARWVLDAEARRG